MKEVIFNLTRIREKMRDKPRGQRLHHFFNGKDDMITVKQLNEVERIIDKEYDKVKVYLKNKKEQVVGVA